MKFGWKLAREEMGGWEVESSVGICGRKSWEGRMVVVGW